MPYRVLTQVKQAYEIMRFRDLGYPYTAIAKKYGTSAARVRQTYSRMKQKQIRLYIRHIAEKEDPRCVWQLCQKLYECYQNRAGVCAYLEKRYPDILKEYREGEPGMPEDFLESLPPLILELSGEVIAGMIEMRKKEKKTFSEIGRQFHLTQERVKKLYDRFYGVKIEKLLEQLEKKEKPPEEIRRLRQRYIMTQRPGKAAYDRMIEENPGLLNGVDEEVLVTECRERVRKPWLPTGLLRGSSQK